MATPSRKHESGSYHAMLWILAGVLLIGLLCARAIYPELLWLTLAMSAPLLGIFGVLIRENQKALRSRSAAYGLNSLVTVILVIGIVGVLNFLGARYPYKIDLTKNKVHTLSDQTVKVVKSLSKPVKATFFSKLQQREQSRPLLENYKSLNPKFEIEFVDPDREPTRAKQNGVKKYGTLQLTVGTRDSKIEDITEEKMTNALIKLLKEKAPTLCVTTGHGEKSFQSQEAEGYSFVKKALEDQSYETREIALLQDSKVLEGCDALALVGPSKAFFAPELSTLRHYLDKGGKALIAIDIDLKGGEPVSDLLAILHDWSIKPESALIVDPLSRMLGVDSSVAILASFSKDNPITKDFQGNCAFPFARPLEILPNPAKGIHVNWLAQTTPKSWGVTDLKQLAKGEVQFMEGKDKQGPLNAAVVAEGKKGDSTVNSRLIVFGSSHFATNQFSRYAGNSDFFLNSVSWLMEDESLISIREKEEGPGKVELSQKEGTFVLLLTVIIIPFVIAAAGVGIWFYRRKL